MTDPISAENTHPLILAALAMSKTHAAVITFSDGSVHRLETRSEKTALLHLDNYRHQVGKDLISRATGETIRIVSREVVAL